MENKKLPVDDNFLFDNPKNIKRLLYFLYGSCILLFMLDFVIHRHVIHSWENLWGFYPVYGFVGCVVLVVVATWMRTFLMRPEDYYADEGKSDFPTPPCVEESHKDKTGGHHVDD